MKQIYVIYDDSRKPNSSISNINGKKGFGETIFKRITLRDRMKKYYESLDFVKGFINLEDVMKADLDKETPVILIYSDFVIVKPEEVEILANKVLYAHENYRVVQNNKIACVIFTNITELMTAKGEDFGRYTQIKVNCFADISNINNFRQFITSGFEARFFNSLSGDEYTVIKTSDNKNKLEAEYRFYGLLPESMKQWFVRPFDFKESEESASYSMQRYNMTDLAIRYIHGAIEIEEFDDILNKLFYFAANRVKREVSSEIYEKTAEDLYVNKVKTRIDSLKANENYEKIASLIRCETDYDSIDDIFARYEALYRKMRKGRSFESVQVVGHGDMCFSNILYSKEASLLMLIDPKGAMCEDELYMDPYYDLAKLSHSVCGLYDFFNSDLYEIVVDEELKAHITVFNDNRPYVQRFREKLEEQGMDLGLIRLYEASLFLSMLPLHMDRPKKVYAFVLNAIAILDSIEKNIS